MVMSSYVLADYVLQEKPFNFQCFKWKKVLLLLIFFPKIFLSWLIHNDLCLPPLIFGFPLLLDMFQRQHLTT